MPRRTQVALVAAASLLAATLTGCGQQAPQPEQSRQTADNGEVYNAADAAFASRLIAHHAAALTLVDQTRGRRLSPELGALVDVIQMGHPAEIEQMVVWLKAWELPIPETMRGHANAGDGSASQIHIPAETAALPGMFTTAQLRSLQQARGQAFETLWLEVMVAHHRGALQLAATEQTDGVYRPAVQAATTVQETQQDQLDQMLTLLSR